MCQYGGNIINYCDEKKCRVCFDLSFACFDHSECWDYEKNNLGPRQVCKYTATEYWFKCNKCLCGFKVSPVEIIKTENWCTNCR
jgi:hypothetical protein